MTEEEFRSAIEREALLWVGTPYKNCGRILGVGANCAQLLFGIALGSGAIAADSPEPRWYSPQFATHQREERLISYVLAYGAAEIEESQLKRGDIVLYKTGQSHGHAAIALDWPDRIIHTLPPSGCQLGRGMEARLAAYTRRYFTLWKGSAA